MKYNLQQLIEIKTALNITLDEALKRLDKVKSNIKRKNNGVLHVCENHTGKMWGLWSLSTSVILNHFCQKNRQCEKGVCKHCFSNKMSTQYSQDFNLPYYYNTLLLSDRVLSKNELPVIATKYFRFEAFADLNNETQLINYINIANKNKDVKCALWTKNYILVYNYFKSHKCPGNLKLVISSYELNRQQDITFLKKTGAFKKGQLKVFTVYNYEYLKDHMDTKINCGAASCLKCGKCYNSDIEVINEVLKSDASKYYKALSKIQG